MSLRRVPMPRARSRIKAVSNRRRKQNVERKTAAIETFGTDPACGRCGLPAWDLHERLSRARGGSITDMSNCVPLCRKCHTTITDPRVGEPEGWSVSSPPRRPVPLTDQEENQP